MLKAATVVWFELVHGPCYNIALKKFFYIENSYVPENKSPSHLFQ
jgi:hypothetical protein